MKMNDERKLYLKKVKKNKLIILISQISILVIFILSWELAARFKMIDTFITSSPSEILSVLFSSNQNLLIHTLTTLYEVIIGFLFGTTLGILISIILWWSNRLSKILEPYLVIFNALPKVALGPLIIVWAGNGFKSILVMTILISIIVTILNVLTGFNSVDEDKIKLIKTFGATKLQILQKVIIPASMPVIVSTLKITMGLTWIGVIMGEFLVSNKGLGYLIIYGSQVFQLKLVMTSIIILAFLTSLMYFIMIFTEKKLLEKL